MIIQPFIHEQFNGDIWRMEIDDLSETIFVEIRNQEEKKAFFGAVSLITGEVYFKDFTPPERWLTGIEAAFDSVLLLHYYQSEIGPTHKGLLAIDGTTAKTLWSNYNYAFDDLSINGPVVYDSRVQPRKLFLANMKTGATTGVYEPSVDLELKNKVVLPQVLAPEHLPTKLMPTRAFGNTVHYLEYNNLIIVSLHALKGSQLTQSLYIMEGAKSDNNYRALFDDLLNSDIQKIQPEAFIMHKNHLIYIKNKSELKVLGL